MPGNPLATRSSWCYTIHMKRTNLVLRADLLEEATRLSGEKTYSRAVERALEDFVLRARARRILELRGSSVAGRPLRHAPRRAGARRRRS
jgi:Arc/MetJ family transcription regulator